MSLKIQTLREKQIWNEAVEATLKEVYKYDGMIPSSDHRAYLVDNVKKKVAYQRLKKQSA